MKKFKEFLENRYPSTSIYIRARSFIIHNNNRDLLYDIESYLEKKMHDKNIPISLEYSLQENLPEEIFNFLTKEATKENMDSLLDDLSRTLIVSSPKKHTSRVGKGVKLIRDPKTGKVISVGSGIPKRNHPWRKKLHTDLPYIGSGEDLPSQ